MGTPSESIADEERKAPGVVDSCDLLENISEQEYLVEDYIQNKWMNLQLRKGLLEGKDYLVIDEFTWEFFKGKYKAKQEIIRYGIQVSNESNECIVELYLRQYLVYPIPNSDTLKCETPLKMMISRAETLLELEKKVCRLLNSRSSNNQGTYFATKVNLWKYLSNDLQPLRIIDQKINKNFNKIQIDAQPLSQVY